MSVSRAAIAALYLLPAVVAPPAAAQSAADPLVIVLDASAAMKENLGRVRRIDIVRKALQEVALEFPGNVPLGLVVFGHRSTGDCNDVEVVEQIQAPGRERRERLTRRLATLQAGGKGSLSRALLESRAVFQSRSGRLLVIVAGTDNCGASPCVVAETVRQSQVPLLVDVVAVGVPPKQRSKFECVSGRLYGRFEAAEDAESARRAILSAALGRMPGGRLRVSVTETGKPRPAAPYITVRQEGRPVAQLFDNPSVFQLPAGDYDVSARLGPHIESPRVAVRVRPGQTLDQALNLAAGTMVVSVARPQGKPLTPMPLIELIRGEDFVASAKSVPARFETGAGTYSVRVTLDSRQQYVAHGLVVEPARTVQRSVTVPAGQVQILVAGRRYQGAQRPFVEVYQESRFVASYSGSPARFQLLAGSYTARVRESGRATVSKNFEMKAEEDLTIQLNVP
jgi:hypothetical protein